MKRVLIIMALVVAMTLPAMGQNKNIYARPNERWFSSSVTNPLWNWLKWADPLVSSGSGAGPDDIWFVDSNVSNEGDGSSWTNAKDTLDEAINLSSTGDWIYVASGHAESGSAANLWDADVAGITIVHLGNGSTMGTYTFADTDTTVAIGAADVTVVGGRFLAGISEVVVGISVEAAGTYFTLIRAEFPEPTTSTFEFNIAIQLTTASNDVSIIGCKAYSADATGADHWLNGGAGVVNRLSVVGNLIHGEFAISAIFSDQIDLENYLAYNTITNMTTAQHCIENTAASTGTCEFNTFFTDAEGTTLDPGSMKCIKNYVTTAIDASAVIVPARDDTAQNFQGVDGANNAAATTNVTSNGDGSELERLEFLQVQSDAILAQLGRAGVGIGGVAYVDSVTGSDSDTGLTWALAEATLDAAVADTTADKGWFIFVAPLHNENLTGADAVDLDVAGITVIGIGNGQQKPRFDFDDAAAEIVFGAASVKLVNVALQPGATVVLKGIDVEDAADYAIIEKVDFLEGEAAGTDEFIDSVIVGTTATDATIKNCTSFGTGTDQDTFVNLDAATIADATVIDCTVFGNFDEAPIWGGAAVPTNISIRNNVITNNETGQQCIEFQGAATGVIADNLLSSDTYGAVLDPGSARVFGNKQTIGINQGAIDVPLINGKTYSISTSVDEVTADLFDVDGGSILILNITGVVDVAIGGNATSAKLLIDRDDGSADTDFSTSVAITSDVVGNVYVFSNANAAVLTPLVPGANGSTTLMTSWYCPEGMVEQTMTADPGGAAGDHITWSMTFIPLEDGISVVPQG